MTQRALTFSLLIALLAGCGETPAMMMDSDAGPPPATTLLTGAPVSFAPVYDAVSFRAGGASREWIPTDLAVHPEGELWVIQRMERDPSFDEMTECTMRGLAGNPNDCVSLQGSTVGITSPASLDPATEENGRANLVVDANSWHFMRRPSGIVFGDPAVRFGPGDPGAEDAMVTSEQTYINTFGTCHEHWTGNQTDGGAFIGPSLWTADPAIYNGRNGSFMWSNGSHLDMVHATQYCMGIAWEGGNVYWNFNGAEGTLDRYDFGSPHYEGHSDHDDATVTRFLLRDGDGLVRVPFVPSNMEMRGTQLFVADTGNGRVLRVDTDSDPVRFAGFRTFESLPGDVMDGIAYSAVIDSAALSAAWGGAAEPSGLALYDDNTLAVANHASGHISLIGLDGTIIRTIDTGLGGGLAGLTVLDGTIYFVHMVERRIYRIDVTPAAS